MKWVGIGLLCLLALGVGVVLDMRHGRPVILDTYFGSPAHRAGILPGDIRSQSDPDQYIGATRYQLELKFGLN